MTEEGFRANIYADTKGNRTIGYGCNLETGWSQELAAAVLGYQAQSVWQQLSTFWWWAALDDVRASVLVDLGFNDGVTSLLHFPKMLAAIGAKDWAAAKAELLDSDAARELPARYSTLAEILLTGIA